MNEKEAEDGPFLKQETIKDTNLGVRHVNLSGQPLSQRACPLPANIQNPVVCLPYTWGRGRGLEI